MLRVFGATLGPRIGLLALLVSLGACASTTSERASADSIRVKLHDYGSSTWFELTSESHTDRLAYYSARRGDAARKIQADEVMRALMQQLDREGYAEYATSGRAPSAGSAVISRALEVEADGVTTAWAIGSGSAPDERLAFNACMRQFFELYNISASYQAIENAAGLDPFRAPPARP